MTRRTPYGIGSLGGRRLDGGDSRHPDRPPAVIVSDGLMAFFIEEDFAGVLSFPDVDDPYKLEGWNPNRS